MSMTWPMSARRSLAPSCSYQVRRTATIPHTVAEARILARSSGIRRESLTARAMTSTCSLTRTHMAPWIEGCSKHQRVRTQEGPASLTKWSAHSSSSTRVSTCARSPSRWR